MPRLLDLFCGAGGCTKGYQLAGFYVVGVDIAPQPHYLDTSAKGLRHDPPTGRRRREPDTEQVDLLRPVRAQGCPEIQALRRR
jgi:site-specific DNA-cytosine methylase